MDRNIILDKDVNKLQIIPNNSVTGKKGKGAGYYCEHCNVTFKDSLQWLDHINSKWHLQSTGQKDPDKQPPATLKQVLERIEYLENLKKQKNNQVLYDIKKNIEKQKEIERNEREKRLKKNREKRVKRKEKKRITESITENLLTQGFNDIASAMGFTNFASTKM